MAERNHNIMGRIRGIVFRWLKTVRYEGLLWTKYRMRVFRCHDLHTYPKAKQKAKILCIS